MIEQRVEVVADLLENDRADDYRGSRKDIGAEIDRRPAGGSGRIGAAVNAQHRRIKEAEGDTEGRSPGEEALFDRCGLQFEGAAIGSWSSEDMMDDRVDAGRATEEHRWIFTDRPCQVGEGKFLRVDDRHLGRDRSDRARGKRRRHGLEGRERESQSRFERLTPQALTLDFERKPPRPPRSCQLPGHRETTGRPQGLKRAQPPEPSHQDPHETSACLDSLGLEGTPPTHGLEAAGGG